MGFLHSGQSHELCQLVCIMSTQYEVNSVGAFKLSGFGGGPNAAGQGDLLDAAFFFQAAELAEMSADTIYGVLADVTGVEHNDVSVLVAVDLGVARLANHAPHPIRGVDVHRAANRLYAPLLRPAVRCDGVRRFSGHTTTHTLPPARKCELLKEPLRGVSRRLGQRCPGNSTSLPDAKRRRSHGDPRPPPRV